MSKLQLAAFVMMNPTRHTEAYRTYWVDQLRGEAGAAAARAHEKFYDEYNAVLDMDAAYYLDTVRLVFQDFALYPHLTVGANIGFPLRMAGVAPGIAEALFATAIGLIAAIPATIFYNKFTSEVNRQAQRLEGFADEFSAILSRQIDERA